MFWKAENETTSGHLSDSICRPCISCHKKAIQITHNNKKRFEEQRRGYNNQQKQLLGTRVIVFGTDILQSNCSGVPINATELINLFNIVLKLSMTLTFSRRNSALCNAQTVCCYEISSMTCSQYKQSHTCFQTLV